MEDLLRKEKKFARSKHDFYAELGDIKFEGRDIKIKDDTYSLTNHAFSQFVSKLRKKLGLSGNVMNTHYLKACPEDSTEYQLNRWLDTIKMDHHGDLFYMRALDNELRAVLSEHYSKLDNQFILETVTDNMPDMDVQLSYLDENDLHLRLVDKEFTKGSGVGEINGGFHIRNSEVGKSSARMDFIIFQLICSNGMISTKHSDQLFNQRHYGATPHKVQDDLIAALNTNAAQYDEFHEYMDSLLQSQEVYIDFFDLDEVYEGIRKEFRPITTNVIDIAKTKSNKYLKDAKMSKYGLISSLTETARDNYEGNGRYDIEAAADKVLKLDKIETEDRVIDLSA